MLLKYVTNAAIGPYCRSHLPANDAACPSIIFMEADLNLGVSEISVADDVMQYVQISPTLLWQRYKMEEKGEQVK